MLVRTMRAMSPTSAMASVKTGRTRWRTEATNVSGWPASRLSMVMKPVTCGGGAMPVSRRPPKGNQPRRE